MLTTVDSGLLSNRPPAAEGYLNLVYYSTDAKQSFICVRNGASSFAWRPISGGERFAATPNLQLLYRMTEDSGDIINYGSLASSNLTAQAGYVYQQPVSDSTIGNGGGFLGTPSSYLEGAYGSEPGSGDLTVFAVFSTNGFRSKRRCDPHFHA